MTIGDGYVEDIIQQSNLHSAFCVGDDALQPKELTHLQKFLMQVRCPSWHTPIPQNLGEVSHSKLKVDQWQSAIEFNVTTAIAHVWSHDHPCFEDEEHVQWWKMLVEATILLATAIQWATSYHTSKMHAAWYMHCMVTYLKKTLSCNILALQSPCHFAHWTSPFSIWSNAWLVDVHIWEGNWSSSKNKY